MSLTFPSPVARQYNRGKYSSPLRQNKYHSKPHTPPDKRGASVKGNPAPDNQHAHQISQYNKNSKKTPSSDSSDFSIAAVVL